jgi:steroid delta-isomerase-like uncharacterized protein
MTDNITLVRDVYDAWNERDFDRQAEAMAPDVTITMMGSGDVLRGPEGGRQFGMTWADAFPDGRVTLDMVAGAGDTVVVEFTGRGTHTGALVTSMGTIPPTGRSVVLHFCDVLELRDGKIAAQRNYLDTGSLMAQLGMAGQESAATQGTQATQATQQ